MRKASYFILRTIYTRGVFFLNHTVRASGRLGSQIPSSGPLTQFSSSSIWQSKTRFFYFPNAFRKCSHMNLQTVAETTESLACEDGIFATFEALESVASEVSEKLQLVCLEVIENLYSTTSDDHEKTMSCAFRALKILEKCGNNSLSIAKALVVLGSSSFKLNRFRESLEALEAAEQVLEQLEHLGHTDCRPASLMAQLLLAEVKVATGRRKESLLNLRRSLELRNLITPTNNLEIALAYKDVAEAYATVLDFKEALPLCWKAFEVYNSQAGNLSLEIAEVQRLLAVVYYGLGEFDEALVQNEICQRALKDLGLDKVVLDVEIEAANIHISAGRLGEAIKILKDVIEKADKESETRALVFVSMAKALFEQEKFRESRRCLEIACGIFSNMESANPGKVAGAYAEISILYEAMTDFEIAIALMKNTLTMLEEHPEEQHLQGSLLARLGWLFLLTERADQAIPCLESAIEKLKRSFGPRHFGLGLAYKHLGNALVDMGNLHSAVDMLALGRNIIATAFGTKHEDYIDTCQCLANAYGFMGNYALALKFQECVIEAWESHGPSVREELREACRLFEQLKRKSLGSPSAVFPANSLPSSIRS